MGFWEGKRVVVTGGKGFLGSHISDKLREAGAEVVALGSKDYNLTVLQESLRMMRENRPDVVIHAAADVGGIGYNRLYPADIFYNNLAMTVNILEAARCYPPEKLIIIGSACAYPGEATGKLREEDFLAGPMHESVEVYGLSKRALYIGARAYRKQYGLKSIFLVLTNLYGPRDKFDPEESHVVAALIRKFVEAKRRGRREVVVWGTGRPVREFLYVEDCAEAVLLAGERYDDPEPLNIGTGIGTTIKELAETIRDIVGFEGEIVWDTTKPDGAMMKVLDVSRMVEKLGWRPKTSLREGLEKTIAWYCENFR